MTNNLSLPQSQVTWEVMQECFEEPKNIMG